MSTRKYGIIAQAVLLAVFAALLAAGSVYDGLIAEKLYTGKGIITVTTEAIGKMPLFLAAAFACAAAFFTVRRPDSARSMTAAVFPLKVNSYLPFLKNSQRVSTKMRYVT